MKEKNLGLPIPEALRETVEFVDGQEVTVTLTDTGLLYQLDSLAKKVTVPLIPVIVASVLAMVAMAIVFMPYHQIPLVGMKSIASVVIITGVLTGVVNFTYFFTKNKNNQMGHLSSQIFWRNYPVVLISFTLLLVVSLLFGFWIIGELFSGATFDVYTSSLMGGIVIGVVNYLMIHTALSITPTVMIRSLITIILGGVGVAMITNRDQQWWLYNFSFLGTPEATRSWQFNLTLILSAFLMIALIDYVFVLLYEVLGKSKNLLILKLLLIATAICLGGVGFFPYNDSVFYQNMHNRVAGYLVYLFIILIIAIKWLLPSVSKEFLRLSYILGGVLVIVCILFLGVHYFSLTAFELMAFVIAFSWLLLLMQYLINIINTHGKTFKVIIHTTKD